MKSGNPDASRKTDRNELGLRDRRILADVIRFRLTTNEFIHSQHLGHAQANAVVKITGRLVRQGWLIAFQLFERQQYFVPGPSSIKLYGLPATRSRPLGPQSLASCDSVMKYCITTEAVLLANDELLTSLFPWMDGKLLTNPQVVEIAERVSTLRLIRVDLGGTPEHVAKKCLHDVKVRQSKAEFNQLVADSRFVLVVLTPSDSKQEQVKKAISKWKWPIQAIPHTATDDSSSLLSAELITARDFARMLAISERTLYRLKSTGELPTPVILGGSVRWRLHEIRDWILEGCPKKQNTK